MELTLTTKKFYYGLKSTSHAMLSRGELRDASENRSLQRSLFTSPVQASPVQVIMLLPPQGFGAEAKTRGGTLGVPGCIHTMTKNIC